MPGELLGVLAPTFVCAALGWGWGRWGPGYDTVLITALISNIGAPCLVFSELTALDVEGARRGEAVPKHAMCLSIPPLHELPLSVIRGRQDTSQLPPFYQHRYRLTLGV